MNLFLLMLLTFLVTIAIAGGFVRYVTKQISHYLIQHKEANGSKLFSSVKKDHYG